MSVESQANTETIQEDNNENHINGSNGDEASTNGGGGGFDETSTNGQTQESHENGNGTGEATNGQEKQQNGRSGSQTDPSKLEPEHFRKVFVGSLNYITTEDTLRSYFGKYGEVIDSVIMKEAKTNKSRGFGFVTYTKSTCVDELMKGRPHKLDGRELETKRATPREDSGKPGAESTTKKLFVGAIKDGLTEDNLREYFGKYGNIEDCVIMKEKDTNKLRGFGFVTFDDYDPVDKIVLEKFHIVNNQSVAVKKALPKDQTDGSGGGGGGGGRNSGQGQRKNFNGKQQGNNRGGGGGGGGGQNRNHNRNNNNFNDNYSGGGGGGFNNFAGGSYGAANGNYNSLANTPAGGNMNLNNFAMFAQKMIEAAAAGNMQIPFGGGGGANPNLNGGFGAVNQFTPNNLMDNFGGGGGGGGGRRMGAGGNNRPVNFASDDFEEFDGFSNNNKMNNGPGPMRGNNNRGNRGGAPYGNKRKQN